MDFKKKFYYYMFGGETSGKKRERTEREKGKKQNKTCRGGNIGGDQKPHLPAELKVAGQKFFLRRSGDNTGAVGGGQR